MKRLTMPPFLIGLVILFWGWHTNQWVFAPVMAIAYEGHRAINSRWNFTDVDIRRAASISTVSLIGLYTFVAVTGRWLNAVSIFFHWLPIILFPILLLQTYSVDNKINFRSLLLFVKFDEEIAKRKRNFNVTHPYFVICLLSASANPEFGFSFYIGLTLITLIPLWQLRSPRFKLLPWLFSALIAVSLGFVSQAGLHRLHLYAEQQAIAWLSQFYQGQADPFKQSTSLGEIGEIKQSNAIAFRVKSSDGKTVPRLFREAVYNKYQGELWIATDNRFEAINSDATESTWQWHNSVGNSESVTITDRTINNKAILKLPPGSFRVEQLSADILERNQYGAVRFEAKQKLVQYKLNFQADLNFDAVPNANDLFVPKSESAALEEIIQTQQFSGQQPTIVLNELEQFFLTKFRYSLDLTGAGDRPTPVSSFLLDQRTGHCEYFATATTLLLREMGIPARYAVGYSAHEYNQLEQQYLVRDRHAHAWTMAYIDGKWQNFDTTPPSWTDIEDQEVRGFSFVGDFWSWGKLQLTQILGDIFTPENIRRWWWIILPILLLRMWTIKAKNNESSPHKIPSSRHQKKVANLLSNSHFTALEKVLSQKGFARQKAQPISFWLQNLRNHDTTKIMVSELDQIVQWYYRDRFDPKGLSAEESEDFKQAVDLWLQRWQS
ncbi:MAG: transglutaminase domain-containing protein [Limnothrix sp.]